MIKIGYFCTGGYTEIGAIKSFLEKINPNVDWIRCFPTADKPCLVRGRMNSTPIASHNGITGPALIDMMYDRLSKYYKKSDFDGFLLIDDLDCRFYSNFTEGISLFEETHSDKVKKILERQVAFYALFASPEVEAWFLADWRNSFAKQYPIYVAYKIREKLKRDVLKDYWDEKLELYGGKFVNGGCKSKISSEIQDAFSLVGIDEQERVYSYSKRNEGVDMLRRIEPEQVSRKCNICFLPQYSKLKAL